MKSWYSAAIQDHLQSTNLLTYELNLPAVVLSSERPKWHAEASPNVPNEQPIQDIFQVKGY